MAKTYVPPHIIYKNLILEVLDRHFLTPDLFSKTRWMKNYKVVTEAFRTGEKYKTLKRTRSIDEDFQKALNELHTSRQSSAFSGYDRGLGHLVENEFHVWHWIEIIKRLKGGSQGLKGLSVRNAIIQEMKRQEREAEHLDWDDTETPPQTGKGEKKDTETPTYRWEFDENKQEATLNGKGSGRLIPPRIYKTYKVFLDSNGPEVRITSIHKNRDTARDYVNDLKNALGTRFELSREILDRIFKPKKNTRGKITAFIFERNLPKRS